jgi:hypothetical protein
LALILEENLRGIGVVRDELSAWLASFNQYKAGRGSDASQWLELHRGGPLIVDRKTAERRMIYVPRAAASIGGTIQPGVIKRGYGKEQFENGMVAGTLFAMPPARQRKWTDRHVEEYTRDRVTDIYRALASLDFDREGEPVDLPLSSAAQERFIRFVDKHGEEQARLGGRAARGGVEQAGRICRTPGPDCPPCPLRGGRPELEDPNRIDEGSIACGITLTGWFGHEARRVYADMGMSDEDRHGLFLVELVRRKGGFITPRDLTRYCRRYPTTDEAERALDELVGLHVGDWKHIAPGPSGGHPQKHFVLSPVSADTDETPDWNAPPEVSSAAGAEKQGSVGADVEAESEAEFERHEREAVDWDHGSEGVHHA